MLDLNRIRAWWNGGQDPLQDCDSADVGRIAADLCLSPHELRGVMRTERQRRDLLMGMMAAKDLDAAALSALHPSVMRSVEVSCTLCPNGKRCARELAQGTAALNAADFCANAQTFDALAVDFQARNASTADERVHRV